VTSACRGLRQCIRSFFAYYKLCSSEFKVVTLVPGLNPRGLDNFEGFRLGSSFIYLFFRSLIASPILCYAIHMQKRVYKSLAQAETLSLFYRLAILLVILSTTYIIDSDYYFKKKNH
jgi:hypothetical protein